ncbi:MAG: hypothetical protein HZT39_16520 [Pseudoxanthomonas sp.]|nr:MAG: hypothetical protein HZT39_16520 [Pseudoxanthomonas sp.]
MNKEDVVAYIRSEIASDARLSGAQLTQRLKEKWSDWSPQRFGSKTLRSFITENLPEFTELGRAGLDPIYGVPPAATQQAALEGNLWRAWSSPKSPYAVVVAVATGTAKLVAVGGDVGDQEIKLSSPDSDFHREIARDFLKIQFPGVASDLVPLITNNPQWWQQWVKEIRKRGISASWGQFRFHRLLSSFEKALDEHQLSPSARDAAVIQLRSALEGEVEPARKVEGAAASSRLHELRRVAIAVVESLSEEELRELKLPLGLMVDAMRRKQ